VLTGSARLAQEARDLDAETRRREELEEKTSAIERRHATIEAQIVALRSELAAEEKKLQNLSSQDAQRKKRVTAELAAMARSRRTRPEMPAEDDAKSNK
jgi:circadian clock protein KaiC